MGKKGGSSKTTVNSYDPVASAKMAEIAQDQQDIADEQWDMYKQYFQDYEIAAAQANKDLLPYITESSRLTLQEQKRDLELNQPLKDALRNTQMQEVQAAAPIADKFYKESLEGVDLGKRADEAGANVNAALSAERGALGRNLSRYGVDPGSSRFRSGLDTAGVTAAGMVAGARNQAVKEGETENYNRLGMALGMRNTVTGLAGVGSTQGQGQTYFGNADPVARAQTGLAGASATTGTLASRVLSSKEKESGGGGFWDFAGNVLGKAAGAYATGGRSMALG